MAGYLNLIQPAELNAMVKDKPQKDVIAYLEGLIRAHAPAYKARK